MTQLEKNLKLACIACLFTGFAALCVGILTGVQTVFDTDAVATVACGVGAIPGGAQSARLANVPSNATKVRRLAIILVIASIVFAAIAMTMGDPTPLQIAVLVGAGIVALLMMVFAQRLVKRLEQV